MEVRRGEEGRVKREGEREGRIGKGGVKGGKNMSVYGSEGKGRGKGKKGIEERGWE